ncbi:uncharacterized protein AKAME5_002438400 [Lates japonicus]|uniref:Uncharacterized protein n=1 Tax=Lates japonicus TaxID=270547 RepID=A0AAD3NJA3_LATJO|nr:uncharacterized protein AKAME5_002438400 [Lates japonicus]
MSAARKELQEALCRYITDTFMYIDTVRGFCEKTDKWVHRRETELNSMTDVKDRADKLDLSFRHVSQSENKAKAFWEYMTSKNVEVLSYQLDKYIQTTQTICGNLEKSDFCLKMTKQTLIDLDVDLSEGDIQKMLYHINQLEEIRMNRHFRMVFMFQNMPCSHFISEFNERQPRMLEFLKDLEESAVQLDRMSKGAKISSVAGSSVGAVGGVLSIVGLALIPVTFGVSSGLLIAGISLGVTSGVNSAVTTVTEIGVNRKHQKKASEVFQSFMEDVQSLQDCLEEVTSQPVTKIKISKIEVGVGVSKVLFKAGAIGKGIDSIVDAASGFKFFQSEEVFTGVGKVVAQEGKALRNVPRVASDIPDIGQAAVKGPLALSKSARAGFITLNALFLGMDIIFICKDSISLAKGQRDSSLTVHQSQSCTLELRVGVMEEDPRLPLSESADIREKQSNPGDAVLSTERDLETLII